MSKRFAESLGSLIHRRTSRRGFLARVAVVGSAASVAPIRLLTRPTTAWAVLQPRDRARGTRCASYTEFCCSRYFNGCPDHTFVGGWWRARAPTGSRFCNGGPRYYFDCNTFDRSHCNPRPGCYNNTCDCWRWCYLKFAYGNCNTRYQGDRDSWVVCRAVMCENPCRTRRVGASRKQPGGHCSCKLEVDDGTRYHEACDPCG